MAIQGHLAFTAAAWVMKYRAGLSDTDWPIFRDVAIGQLDLAKHAGDPEAHAYIAALTATAIETFL